MAVQCSHVPPAGAIGVSYTYSMIKPTTANRKQLKDLGVQLKVLQEQLVEAKKREGYDPYIEVKVRKNQARFQRIQQKN